MTKQRTTERGLLMSGPMALAAYRGFKTQTRRPVKFPRPGNWNGVYWSDDGDCDDTRPGWIFQNVSSSISEPDECFDSIRLDCPFGRVGDRIYVRETFSINRNVGPDEYARITYLADGAEHDTDGVRVCPTPNRVNSSPERQRWTPSIHMPKWAARTWGTITDVRVERVQSISEDDAEAEGCNATDAAIVFGASGALSALSNTARGAFACLWDSLYTGALNWTSNPWVWVVAWERDK